MSANPGWYPDPGGGQGLFRYWDGKAWSAATSPNPSAPPPSQGLVGGGTPQGDQPYGQGVQPAYGQSPYDPSYGNAYANYQELEKKKSPIGWWIAGAALVIVSIVVAVLAIRAVTGGDNGPTGGPVGQPSQDFCPPENTASLDAPASHPADGRVHGGPVAYPLLGPPWGPPQGPPNPVPFGADVQTQMVLDQLNYDDQGNNWVASILVAELQAGDGFFTPEQGSQIVVKCILGAFYGNHPINSNVKVNEKTTIDGHDAWLVESQLTFDIPRLEAKGEYLIVAIISAGNRSGLYYATIPDTLPELVQPARDTLKQLQVDG
ncbi:MAG TPA: DUF2510 domain-containing protein [Propionibacteriaceae bacterium]|nr:DUF2510 domain-containing protein [Propionibacteriaceae bacterium]